MILYKRSKFLVACCVVCLLSLLIVKRYRSTTSDGRLNDILSQSDAQKSSLELSNEIQPVMENYKKSKIFKPARENVHWKNGRLLFNLSDAINLNRLQPSAKQSSTKYIKTKYQKLKMAWFSLKDKWETRKYPLMFTCVTGKVLMTKAGLDPAKVKGADVVVFAGGVEDENLWRRLQASRDARQIWLLNTDESPMTTGTYIPPKQLRHITFNITFTYHTNADISVPYGFYEKYNGSIDVKPIDYHKASPKFAAWMSSRCDILWNREGFLSDLSRLIPIDKYGTCGGQTCGSTAKYRASVVSKECKKILRQYKFHFTLENSCCAEYISQDFWNILVHYDSIPIVIGARREDYERLAPPNSFIYAADFKSPEELSKFINYVASDPDLFNSFFEWKSEGKVHGIHEKQRQVGFSSANCRILEYLQKSNTKQTHQDLYGPDWIGGCSECGDVELLRRYRTK